ncbi:alpha/beta fold hydrolase [Streptomyces malaysiensis]|uniref:alpha/beta fold hydrolase n=1 Tax=Streptomyces malaysiensis TaxID=92644 RepID=UPI002B2C8548|nr:alpha/beta hydrolase [Streptomyces malaysiensis]
MADQPRTTAPPSPGTAPAPRHHHLTVNGLRQHVVTCGTGPAVVFCHGFPDMGRVWRHQVSAVARAGYTAIVPDLRGFGETEAPADASRSTALDVVGDLVVMLDHFGVEKAVIIGHDWGANVSWAAPVLRPDRFTAVASLAVPFAPRPPASLPDLFRQQGLSDLYMVYFSEPGPADAELDAAPETFLRRFYYTLSGELPASLTPNLRVGPTGLLVDSLHEPGRPLSWFDDEEISVYAAVYRKRGFTSALDSYRGLRRGWELMAPWADRVPEVPALYIYGEREIVLTFPGRADLVSRMTSMLPAARSPVMLPGVGHWPQLEAPEAVNRVLLEFLGSLDLGAAEPGSGGASR